MNSFPSDTRFHLRSGNLEHVFVGNCFPNMSDRARKLLKRGIISGTTKCRAEPSAFQAFVSACELQNFRLTTSNVFQLLNMAVEWEVKSLVNFCQEFVITKRLKPLASVNPVNSFFTKYATGKASHNDILKFTSHINDAFLDDRMLSLSPEVLFEIIINAKPKTIDEQKFVTFVMRLLELKPSTAGPLILLLNRELLTPKQQGRIARSRKIHEQNVQFFVGWTMSHIRNETENSIRALFLAIQERMSEVSHEYEAHCDRRAKKLGRGIQACVASLKKEVEENERRLNAMIHAVKLEAQEFDNEKKEFQAKLNALKCELRDLNDTCALIRRHSAKYSVKLSVQEEVTTLKRELEEKITAASKAHADACERILTNHKNDIIEQQTHIDKMFMKGEKLLHVESTLTDDINNLKSILLAKIIRDKIRNDDYIRDCRPVFAQTSPQQKRAEEFITAFEAKLEKTCPIRGKQK